MDKVEKTDARSGRDARLDPDIACSACGARGKALAGADEETRKSRYKCRKCDEDFWENQATGMINHAIGEEYP